MSAQTGISYKINKWYGWLSDTDALMWEAQYSYGEDIEVGKNPEYVTIARAPESIGSTDKLPYVAAGEYCASYDGEIYYTLWAQKVHTVTWTPDIINIEKFVVNDGSGNYVPMYIWMYKDWVQGKIGTIEESDTSWGSSWSGAASLDDERQTWLNVADQYPTAILDNDFLYIGHGNAIARLTKEGIFNTTGNGTIKGLDGNVVYISVHNSALYVYTDSGRYYIRVPGETNAVDGNYQINSPVRAGFQMGNTDYIVAGEAQNVNALYRVVGSQVQLLKKAVKWAGGTKFQFDRQVVSGNGIIDEYYGKIFICDKGSSDSIVTFGNEFNGFPNGFNKYLTRNPNWDNELELWFIKRIWTKLYFGWEDSSNNRWIASLDLRPSETVNFQPTAEAYSQLYTRWVDRMQLREINVRTTATSGQPVRVYYSTNKWSSFTLLTILNDSTTEWRYREFGNNLDIWDFFDLMWKFEMDSLTWGTSAPYIEEFEFIVSKIDE